MIQLVREEGHHEEFFIRVLADRCRSLWNDAASRTTAFLFRALTF